MERMNESRSTKQTYRASVDRNIGKLQLEERFEIKSRLRLLKMLKVRGEKNKMARMKRFMSEAIEVYEDCAKWRTVSA